MPPLPVSVGAGELMGSEPGPVGPLQHLLKSEPPPKWRGQVTGLHYGECRSRGTDRAALGSEISS
eukprot:2343023-Rhodomonas_salina.2